ncbi:MAG: helix-turn-helix domain-containing protein [Candidatus Marinimicrobia bacterium]|nr:helix-turn-helix domain-containing protein [Candidatus Neomarinimicrobiota bacterium]
MATTILRIKNMVCPRCIKVVREELEKLGYQTTVEQLGIAKLDHPVEQVDINKISRVLEENGFELLVEKSAKIIETIKSLLIELIYQDQLESLSMNLSDYLARKLNHDYSRLSSLFSAVESITIEKYFILQKIERVKELLIYDELTLSETAYRLGYSSVQHLSNQFKKITGMSPSHFKSLRARTRTTLDKVGQ